jgi:hypothetical protein
MHVSSTFQNFRNYEITIETWHSYRKHTGYVKTYVLICPCGSKQKTSGYQTCEVLNIPEFRN